MKIDPVARLSMDDLATTTVRLGVELERKWRAAFVGSTSHDFGFATRSLRRIAERDPFDPRDDASLKGLRDILDTDLSAEIVGYERRFFETHEDANGQHGEVMDVPVYTQRGQDLLAVQDTLAGFIAARDATLDRIAAVRCLEKLMSA